MNYAFIDILDRFLVVIWPMLRLSAFLAFTSIFSIRAVNIRIRISLAFAMAFFRGFGRSVSSNPHWLDHGADFSSRFGRLGGGGAIDLERDGPEHCQHD